MDDKKKKVDRQPAGASATVGSAKAPFLWDSQTCKFGWNVQGIIPSGNGPSDINTCGMSTDQSLIVTGDDNGLVNVYRNPCLEGHKASKYRAHSEHVTTTLFSDDG